MDIYIYDLSNNSTRSWEEVAGHLLQYHCYLAGATISADSQLELQSKIMNAPVKSPLIIRKKQPLYAQDKDVHQIFSSANFSSHFAASQIQRIKSSPRLLFDNEVRQFKYSFQNTEDIDPHRQNQLINSLLSGSKDWRQASLQQMETIGKNYPKILQTAFHDN